VHPRTTSRMAALVGALLASSVQQPTSANPVRPCHQNPELVGSCYTVRGRLGVYNGSMIFRIWVVGTDRILGVTERRSLFCRLPSYLEDAVRPDSNVLADFVVCPLTADKPGWMREVCVDTAYNIAVRSSHR